MEFGTSGNLSEGTYLLPLGAPWSTASMLTFLPTDGIHIDMNRLKAGEVK